MQPIHDRMPVIISEADHDRWLSGEQGEANPLMVTYAGDMTRYRVDPDIVNNSKHKSIHCIDRYE